MRYDLRYLIFILTVILMVGCSSGSSHQAGFVTTPEIPVAPMGDVAFPDIPQITDMNVYRHSSASFEMPSASLSINSSTLMTEPGASNFTISNSPGGISITNHGKIAFDVWIIADSPIPFSLDTKTIDIFDNERWGLDFGIIPAGKTSCARSIDMHQGLRSVRAHIEYLEKAFIDNDRLRIHSSPFRGRVMQGTTTKAISADSLIVGCDSGVENLYTALLEHKLLLTGLIEPLGLYQARILDDRTPYDVVRELNNDSRLNHAEVESILFPAYFPNDPIYDPATANDFRWAYERIRAIETWDFYSDSQINQAGDASVHNIVFALMDTGLSNHQDLALDSFDLTLINAYGKNFVSPGSPVTDTDGHGTSVAGIMGAMGNNGIGMSGMAWNPYFLPIKIFATSKEYGQVGPLFGLLQGLMYVRDVAGMAPFFKFVVNMSLGGYESTPSYWTTEAINRTSQRSNIILIAGCGNDKNDQAFGGVSFPISADNYFPAALDKVISVGASSWQLYHGADKEVYQEDALNWGTNWGNTVDMCAPGSLSIYTTSATSPTSYDQYFGGTSASCALVSGLVGLVWEQNPDWSRNQVKTRLENSCLPMSVPAFKAGKLGFGRIDAYKSVRGTKPLAIISDIQWTRSGNPIFGDAIRLSGDGVFAEPQYVPGTDDDNNFRWYADGDYSYPIAFGRETLIYKLPAGPHTIQLKVWNKGQQWNFWDPRQSSEPYEWPEIIQIDESLLPSDYFTLIYIPSGEFTMGCGQTDPNFSNPGTDDEKPQHAHFVDGFWIRKYEVTNLEFNAFIEDGGYDTENYWEPEGWQTKTQNGWTSPLNWMTGYEKGGNPIDFPETAANPVNGISWWEADAFCKWAHMKLPTEAQWEKSARGSGEPFTYPWGMDWVVNNCNNDQDSIMTDTTSPIGLYSPVGDSPYGLCDAAGNVWEWCWEWYDPTVYSRYEQGDYALPETGETKCCRGGGWFYDGAYTIRCSSRYSLALPSTSRNGYIGLRPTEDFK